MVHLHRHEVPGSLLPSFDSDVLGLYDHLYECENIDELNELGHALLEVRDKGCLLYTSVLRYRYLRLA